MINISELYENRVQNSHKHSTKKSAGVQNGLNKYKLLILF